MTAFPVGSRVELAPQLSESLQGARYARVLAVHTRNHWTTVEVQLDRTGDLHTFHSSDLRRVAA